MKNRLFVVLCLLPCCFGCVPELGTVYGKSYEFIVENELVDKTLKIVPKSKTDFWISSKESYIVASREKIIIGSKVVYDGDKKAKDIYRPDEIIELFDIYIDDIKQEKTLSQRKFWDFSLGKANNSGKYTLVINLETLND
ncbi:MAG: hypothetical protein FWC39_13245 [Bacteroidetes bacterium]|nr:hypothetical protein [Bacteroidota bacterium]MCL2329461.1 hypothetical protein [Bacteroidota bacterium]